MNKVRGWLLRLGEFFGRERRERELAAEMESHLQLHIDENLRAGLSAEEASARITDEELDGSVPVETTDNEELEDSTSESAGADSEEA